MGYIVEGSVRRGDDRVRVNVQLIDATTGRHVWAERYDRPYADVFELQDELTSAIAASIDPEVGRYEMERVARRDPKSLDAWDMLLRANWHSQRRTPAELLKSRDCLERATRLDPHFALAFAYLGGTYNEELGRTWGDGFEDWSDDHQEMIEQLRVNATKAVELDAKEPAGHLVLGIYHFRNGDLEPAVQCIERAIRLAPHWSQPFSLLGQILASSGEPDQAIEKLEHAIRLSPRDPSLPTFLFGLAKAHYAAGRYEEAWHWGREARKERSDREWSLLLAACAAQLGKMEKARQLLAEGPRVTLKAFGALLAVPPTDAAYATRFLDGLRKAGLKEG